MTATPSEPETTPEEYRQRALLFADLGRYDDAAAEVAAGLNDAPQDPGLLATLARVHLVADQPAEALVAADRAVAAGADTMAPLVVRAMALSDNRRYGEAAKVANQILTRWPADAYAQRTGAALLSESRNGQEALNAAWNGVRVAPAEAEAHLVLAVVAARLRLFDLAQRAYAEALDLDEAIGDAQRDVGIVRLERRRWARALEDLADEAAIDTTTTTTTPPPPGDPTTRPPADPTARPAGDPTGRPAGDSTARPAGDPTSWPAADDPTASGELSRPYPAPDRPEPSPTAYDPTAGLRGDVFREPPVSKPSGPVLDPSGDSRDAVRQMILYASNGTLVAALLTALMAQASSGASRVWAGLISVILFVAVLVWLSRRLTEPAAAALSRLRRNEPPMAVAAYAALVAPLIIFGYALIGGLTPLVAAMVVAAAAEMIVLLRR